MDGHHRFYALKNLGCRFAPAFVIDYYDPHIKIERWYPLVKTKREVKSIFKALETDGYSIEQVKNEDVLKVVMDLGQACLGLIVENDHEEFYLAHKNYCNFQEAMEVVKHAIEIEGKRKELDHIGNESEAIAMLKSKEARMAIISPSQYVRIASIRAAFFGVLSNLSRSFCHLSAMSLVVSRHALFCS